ncbi:SDR family NAD(P)-dependent oxidoreductase [Nocardia sp. NPDC051929]|uniref:SDR family NAD(P)-dependent oxidoreductase n=1 Tax=unclassified Nocardia TaxID=2637762 RepID=UPI003431202A
MSTEMKNVLVTGASGGIGTAIVTRLAELGFTVYAGVRNPDGRLSGRHGIQQIELDICDPESIAAARDEISARINGGPLYGLVNNAGISVNGPLELVPIAALRHQMEVNVIGHVAVTQAMLPMLRPANGRIVNIGGAAGRMTLPMYGAMSASKAALDSISSALRMELKYQGVSVSYIEPGAIATGFFATAEKNSAYAGSPEAKAIYTRAIAATGEALAKGKADPPAAVVRAVIKALVSRKPAARYVVGAQAKGALLFFRYVSDATKDRIVMSTLGLGRKQFAP